MKHHSVLLCFCFVFISQALIAQTPAFNEGNCETGISIQTPNGSETTLTLSNAAPFLFVPADSQQTEYILTEVGTPAPFAQGTVIQVPGSGNPNNSLFFNLPPSVTTADLIEVEMTVTNTNGHVCFVKDTFEWQAVLVTPLFTIFNWRTLVPENFGSFNELACPANTTTAACQSQAAVNTAFSTWLATAVASGGCNGVLTNNNTGAPSACGGSTTVTFTFTSTCQPFVRTCQATFTVPPAPPVAVVTCPMNATQPPGQTQAQIDDAFDTWLASASGACNGTLTNNNTGAPPASGGATTVTFTYTSACAPLPTTCQATFTVTPAPPVVLTCPMNMTTTACQTQAAVNSAFATWLATATASGGCGGVLTNNNTGAPSACGGSTTVTFTYTSTCAPLTTTCQATFTVPVAPTVVLTCPMNPTEAAGQTQAQINAAFIAWLATASGNGGCNGVLTNNNTGAPPASGGSTTVTFTYTSTCAPLTTTCQATFTVPAAPVCIPNLNLSNLSIASGTYHSSGDLIANMASIANGAVVVFKSDTGIVLQQDFTVELGGIFDAVIEACPVNFGPVVTEEK